MYQRIFTAALIIASIALSQACSSNSDRHSVAEVTKLENEWMIVNSKVSVLDDSLQAILDFCNISDKQGLSSTIHDEQEKILDITAGYEDFSVEWKRLTKEVRKLKKDIAAGKLSKSKSASELKYYNETLMDAEKIVEGIKSALEETSANIRENLAAYEAETIQLKKGK
jgi:chromosome segregation ATPase